jgi:hypothetical protein
VSPVRYELGFYIPEEDILHSHRRETFKSHTVSGLLNSSGLSVRRTHPSISMIGDASSPPPLSISLSPSRYSSFRMTVELLPTNSII